MARKVHKGTRLKSGHNKVIARCFGQYCFFALNILLRQQLSALKSRFAVLPFSHAEMCHKFTLHSLLLNRKVFEKTCATTQKRKKVTFLYFNKRKNVSCLKTTQSIQREWVSSFLTAHEHIIDYSAMKTWLTTALKQIITNKTLSVKPKRSCELTLTKLVLTTFSFF